MKIDLRKDKGVLQALPFTSSGEFAAEPSVDDDDIIATLKKRHGETSQSKPEKDKSEEKKAKKERNAIPILLVILLLTVAGGSYMLDTIGVLRPGLQLIENYWRPILGLPVVQEVEPADDYEYYYPPDLSTDQVMTDDQFNQLMPVTEDIAALADSLAALPDDSLMDYSYEASVEDDAPSSSDSITIPVENLAPLSDDDIIILNNRSLLLLVTELVEAYPSDLYDGHMFIKRDALRMSAPQGGAWVDSLQAVMDQFVLGSYKADYATGKVEITSKFSLIMAREADFQANILDGLRMLDVLAHPFDEYLTEIVIDLSLGTDNNPAQIIFQGSSQEMQYILTAWAESHTNFLLRSIDIKFRGAESTLTFDIILFDYRS